MYEATERHGTSAGDAPHVLGDVFTGTVGVGKATRFSVRRDRARRTTGRTNCTMKATDGGMPINMAMKETKSTGVSVSQAHDMATRVLGPGASGITLLRLPFGGWPPRRPGARLPTRLARRHLGLYRFYDVEDSPKYRLGILE